MLRQPISLIRSELRKLQNLIYHNVYIPPKTNQEAIDKFHEIYFDSHAFSKTFWLGVPVRKCPFDLWVYQEIIFSHKPDLIIECGTDLGGSTFFFASMCDIVKHGRIISIDIAHLKDRPMHDRITYLLGSSIAKETKEKIKSMIKPGEKVMVILDSNHTRDHVFEELKIYNEFVTKGNYLIVEDSNINSHPVFPEFGPGPMEAIHDFLKINNDFIIDKKQEKFFITFNPDGYLLKVK
ncbi:cephalosporin hydroxylase [Candidatus Woesearchaeota archaeon]|nr:cephalosporin hydroxylase [Candidatus Woesearchaeota archaeon]